MAVGLKWYISSEQSTPNRTHQCTTPSIHLDSINLHFPTSVQYIRNDSSHLVNFLGFCPVSWHGLFVASRPPKEALSCLTNFPQHLVASTPPIICLIVWLGPPAVPLKLDWIEFFTLFECFQVCGLAGAKCVPQDVGTHISSQGLRGVFGNDS